MISIIIAIAVFGFINSLVYLWCFRKFSSSLKANHPEAAKVFHQTIGEAITGKSSQSTKFILQYFWRREYAALNDENLNTSGDRTRLLLIPGLTAFVLASIAVLGMFITSF